MRAHPCVCEMSVLAHEGIVTGVAAQSSRKAVCSVGYVNGRVVVALVPRES